MRDAVALRPLFSLVFLLIGRAVFASPASELEVTIPNPSAPGVELSGTLTSPGGESKFPAILLISGAGPQDRDGTLAGHKPFLVLADYLSRRGFAVLRVDDRGTGRSTGKFEGATTADFATDADAELKFLRTQPNIDPARVGVLGHGEGAIVAAMLASKDPGIAFAVLLACPAVSGMDVLLAQTMQAEIASGVPQEQVDLDAEIGSALYKLAAQGKSEADMQAALNKFARKAPPFAIASWKAQIPRFTNPWLRFFLNYNPATALEHVNCPVLALYGERDLQVLSEQNAPELERALKRAHNKQAAVVVLPNLNYMFQRAKTGLAAEYSTIPEDISPLALHDIGLWLAKITNAPRRETEPRS